MIISQSVDTFRGTSIPRIGEKSPAYVTLRHPSYPSLQYNLIFSKMDSDEDEEWSQPMKQYRQLQLQKPTVVLHKIKKKYILKKTGQSYK